MIEKKVCIKCKEEKEISIFSFYAGIGRLLGDITTELLENAITYIKNTEAIAYE